MRNFLSSQLSYLMLNILSIILPRAGKNLKIPVLYIYQYMRNIWQNWKVIHKTRQKSKTKQTFSNSYIHGSNTVEMG